MAIEYDKLHERSINNYENCNSNEDIKLEDFVVQTGDWLNSKTGISLINDDNLAQDILLENIKVEDLKEQLSENAGNTKNYEFSLEKFGATKVEKCVANENVPTLQEDPLSEDNQTQVNLEINKELSLKENPTDSTLRKSSDPVFCKECNKTFDYEYYYDIHAHSHPGNNSFKCDICKKDFVSPHLLKAHKILHLESKPYQCKICGLCFTQRRFCIRHQDVHSNNKLLRSNNRPFRCDECDKSFQYNCKLKAHKESHIKETVSCEQCGKSFDGKMGLSQHIRSAHFRKTVHICSYCGKTFNQKVAMICHIKIHTGEEPLTCEVCNKSFAWSSALQIHMRVHTGDRPYSCRLCSSKFTCSHSLKRHMKVHTKKEVMH